MKSILPFSDNANNFEARFDELFDILYTTKSKKWNIIQEKQQLAIFKESYQTVPAYKQYIDTFKIDVTTVTKDTFGKIPSVTKKNYLRAYPWRDLCKKKSLAQDSLVMTSTSGSTGAPFYFPRTKDIDVQSSVCHQMFLRSSGISKKSSTLVIDCFGMGVWIGGLITYQAFSYIGERGYPLTIITPGINKREIFQALQNIAHAFDTVILCGYPPFIKDLIDDGEHNGIDWSVYSLKIIFAAESFSETFRDYIAKKAGIRNIYRDMMNIYGSADLGTMAQETPLSILVRRLLLTNEVAYKRFFNDASRLPTLAQYIPNFINFESKQNTIYCTGNNVLPLIRYEIGDNGGVLSYQDVCTVCEEEGIDLKSEIEKAGITDTVTELPFVFVYERSDFSASFYGALIYPEYIKKALLNPEFEDFITGKFTMYTKNDTYENQYLEINIEMKRDKKITSSTRSKILKKIQATLVDQSAEYKKITESLGERALPKIIFWKHGHETHFFGGAKQRWVKKDVQ